MSNTHACMMFYRRNILGFAWPQKDFLFQDFLLHHVSILNIDKYTSFFFAYLSMILNEDHRLSRTFNSKNFTQIDSWDFIIDTPSTNAFLQTRCSLNYWIIVGIFKCLTGGKAPHSFINRNSWDMKRYFYGRFKLQWHGSLVCLGDCVCEIL